MFKIFLAAFSRKPFTLRAFSAALLSSALLAGSAHAAEEPIDFTTYSLEALLDYEIFSVSKKPEKVFEAAAAVFIITAEDIRRSGWTNLPDMLRMVPGMQVARSDPGDFAVSARGFIGEFANKQLVLIDGRTIYSPIFSGVFWEYHDVMLEDIDRIEVIRGPGATMWGANAVNGVINIITRHAADTQGTLVTATVGNTHERYEALRYGGTIGDKLYYKLYAKHMQFGGVDNQLQNEPFTTRAGFRLDWEPTKADDIFISGSYYWGQEEANTLRPLSGRELERTM
ncbi:MAG: TonB-dependent receptor, partial [Deltaproteobacteria bacterium]|nr:TonB-dependent receptor [Deltaproteobacteria bacterium]